MSNAAKRGTVELGKEDEFWKIICEYIDLAAEELKKEKAEFSEVHRADAAEQYKLEAMLLDARIKHLDQLKDFPDTILDFLSERIPRLTNFDPYKFPKEF